MKKNFITLGMAGAIGLAIGGTAFLNSSAQSANAAEIRASYSQAARGTSAKAVEACHLFEKLSEARSEAEELGIEETVLASEPLFLKLENELSAAATQGAPPCGVSLVEVIPARALNLGSEEGVRANEAVSFRLDSTMVRANAVLEELEEVITAERYRLALESYDGAVTALTKTISAANEAKNLAVGDELLSDLSEKLEKAETVIVEEPPENITDLEGLTNSIAEVNEELEASVKKVNSEWEQLEAERLERERLEAEEAVAAEEVSYDSSSYENSYSDTGEGSNSGRVSNWTLYVSNCNGDAQYCVDTSSVTYVDYSDLGLHWIGGHNYGPAGVIADFEVGDIVTVSGSSAAGTYRVTGSIYVPKGTSPASVPKGFAFQTCVGDQLYLVYGTRI